MGSVAGAPQTWLLGSSASSGGVAAQCGIGYAFAELHQPGGARGPGARALRRAVPALRPGARASSADAGGQLTVADSDTEAQRLAWSAKGFLARLTSGQEARACRAPTKRMSS